MTSTTSVVKYYGPNPTIGKCDIDYNRRYNLSKASIGQIMMALSKVNIEKDEMSPYEEYLKVWFSEEIPKFIDKFEALLTNECHKDHDVRIINLTGNMPKYIRIINDNCRGHNYINLGWAPIGDIIAALKHRFKFIIGRTTPLMYAEDFEYNKYFEAMRKDITTFFPELDTFETEFVEAIDTAHKKQQAVYAQTRPIHLCHKLKQY
uniref:Uncharacterized protein n=1 Tax=Mimivirus LCMiAC01 TaxID=2506608 RepID=A0A481YZZ5_9VIRU|nr:MAG: hypothetical protein LCMiAC01_05050 [Mimivirus LCMiAC01]